MKSKDSNVGKRQIQLLLSLMGILLVLSADAMDCPIGMAAVYALGQDGTTGGGNGPIVHVGTKSALASYAGSASPYTIIVDSTSDSSWTNTDTVNVTSDKTIIGANAGVVFKGFGLSLNNASNVIIRNLTITNVNPDAISVRTSHHVWVDHCDLSACSDGLLDITLASDYVTVSWTIFHNHDKVCLVNSGTQHFEDVGKEWVTFHHNWFRDNVQRNPRIGYGLGHVFNNYYTNISSYCVGYHTGASVLVESNYFLNLNNPLNQMYTTNPWDAAFANAKSVGNLFVSCSGNTLDTGIAFNPEDYYTYKFAEDAAANVPAVVKAFAGPMATGATHVVCPTPGEGAIDVTTASPNLQWTMADGAVSWDVYCGTTTSPSFKLNTTSRSYNPGTLAPDTDYDWRVDEHTASGLITGDLFRFRTAPAQASKPLPANNELHAPLLVPATDKTMEPLELTWTPGFDVASNIVYFGTNSTLTPADYMATVTSPVYAPGMLNFGQTYYWRVDTVESNGTVVRGDIWNFKSDITDSTPGRTEAENMVRCGRYFLETWSGASGGWDVKLEGGTGTESPGTLSSVWEGPNGICNLNIAYLDQSTGNGWFGLYVNGTEITNWFASANDNLWHTNLISNVRINTGDEIRIAAYSDQSELDRLDFMDVAVISGPPPAPMGLTSTPGNGLVELSWTASPGATNYIVKRSTVDGGSYVSIATNAAPSYVDSSAVNGTIYYYVVSALGVYGESGNSTPVSAMPASFWPSTEFKSNGTGGGNWNITRTWQMSTNGGSTWVPATVIPTSANATVEILPGDTVTISGGLAIDQVTVDHGGQLTFATEVTTVTNGPGVDLDIDGTLFIPPGNTTSGSISLANNATVLVEADGVIQSQYGNGGTSSSVTPDPFSHGAGSSITVYGTYKMQTVRGTVATCTWQPGSTLEISPTTDGGGNPVANGGMNQAFYNVVYDVSGQSRDEGAPAGLTTILGDLTVSSTSGHYLALVGSANQTLTIGGDVNINGTSKVNLFSFSHGSPASTVIFQKSLNVAPTATLGINRKDYTTAQMVRFAGAGTLNLGSGMIVENTGGAAAYTVSGSYTLGGNWRLNSIAGFSDTLTVSGTLDCGAYSILNASSGNNTFILNSGATLKIGSPNGISISGAFGNIQVNGSRSFSTGANYVYEGGDGQVTGNGLPAVVNNLTIANTAGAVALNQNETVNGVLTVNTNATLDFNGSTIGASAAPVLHGTLKMEVTKSGGSFSGSKLTQTAGTLAYGGALSVTVAGDSLTDGDVIDLFDAPAFEAGSHFSAIQCPSLQPDQSLSASQLAVNGSLVVNQVPTGPGRLTSHISGPVLTLTWPAGQGWRLESQTNSLSAGLTTNGWGTVPGGIDGSNTITINPTNPAVFFRLIYP